MSFLIKCDICGKNSDDTRKIITPDGKLDPNYGTIFSSGPVSIEKENYKGEKYVINVFVEVINEEDYNKTEAIASMSDEEVISQLFNSPLKLNSPYPHVCEACKKQLIKDVSSKGKIHKEDLENPAQELRIQVNQNFMDLLDRIKDINDNGPISDEFEDEEPI